MVIPFSKATTGTGHFAQLISSGFEHTATCSKVGKLGAKTAIQIDKDHTIISWMFVEYGSGNTKIILRDAGCELMY